MPMSLQIIRKGVLVMGQKGAKTVVQVGWTWVEIHPQEHPRNKGNFLEFRGNFWFRGLLPIPETSFVGFHKLWKRFLRSVSVLSACTFVSWKPQHYYSLFHTWSQMVFHKNQVLLKSFMYSRSFPTKSRVLNIISLKTLVYWWYTSGIYIYISPWFQRSIFSL